jgi:hypothetical protein
LTESAIKDYHLRVMLGGTSAGQVLGKTKPRASGRGQGADLASLVLPSLSRGARSVFRVIARGNP